MAAYGELKFRDSQVYSTVKPVIVVDSDFTCLQFAIESDCSSFAWYKTDTAVSVDNLSMLLENTEAQYNAIVN